MAFENGSDNQPQETDNGEISLAQEQAVSGVQKLGEFEVREGETLYEAMKRAGDLSPHGFYIIS